MAAFEFVFDGKLFTEQLFGSGYVSEFQQVIRQFAPTAPQAVLEWGSGISSLVLLEMCQGWNSSLFLTVDHLPAYQQAVFAGRSLPGFLRMQSIRLDPRRSGSDEPGYSTFPLALKRKFDVVFIDGRRRVECAYVAALMAHPETIVILHDYRRMRYQSVLRLYDVVSDGEQFRVMRPRPAVLKALQA
jgi:hypothetical protein